MTDALLARRPELFAAAYRATQARKRLIFTNSRSDAESTITALRNLAERERAPDIYHVHHGSIAPALREEAEDAMRDETVWVFPDWNLPRPPARTQAEGAGKTAVFPIWARLRLGCVKVA